MSQETGIKKLVLQSIQDKDKQYVNPVFFSIIIVGFLIKITLGFSVSSDDGSTGPASSLIWGYGIVIMGLIGIIYANLNPGINEYENIKKLPYSIVLTIVLMVWLITLNINYFKQINSLGVPSQYFMWSNYSSLLLIILLGISILQYILLKIKNPEGESYIKKLGIYSYVLLFFNLITVIIQQIILDSFTVDG